jgi:DNA topoisomerase-1
MHAKGKRERKEKVADSKIAVLPAVLETYLNGALIEGLKRQTERALSEKLDVLRSDEAAVLSFLRDRLEKTE